MTLEQTLDQYINNMVMFTLAKIAEEESPNRKAFYDGASLAFQLIGNELTSLRLNPKSTKILFSEN